MIVGQTMIVNEAGTVAISNMGWVDRGKVWAYQLGDQHPQEVTLSDSNWLSLVLGANDHFVAIHQTEDRSARLTVHSCASIETILSSIELDVEFFKLRGVSKIEALGIAGEATVWSLLPKAYIVRAPGEPLLLLIDWIRGIVEVQPLPWYKKSYDNMYQAILQVAEIPKSTLLLFSVQRDSEPVIYDHVSHEIVQKLKLADRRGNPQLLFRRKAQELWASDFDTMVRLDVRNWKVLDIQKLQEPKVGMGKLFVGSFGFNSEEDICVVSRPFSNDVIGICSSTFAVKFRAEIGGQPEDVGLLRENHVVARDWKTGRLLQGTLKLF